jgi:hypothetical protein
MNLVSDNNAQPAPYFSSLNFEGFGTVIENAKRMNPEGNQSLMLEIMREIVQSMIDKTELYDESSYFIEQDKRGQGFATIARIVGIGDVKTLMTHLDEYLLIFYRLYEETKFRTSGLQKSIGFKHKASDLMDEFAAKPENMNQWMPIVNGARYILPTRIFENYYQNVEKIESFIKDFKNVENDLGTKLADLEKAYNIKQEQVEDLTNRLENNKQEGTFVLLNQAFATLRTKKETALSTLKRPLFWLGCGLVVVPFLALASYVFCFEKADVTKWIPASLMVLSIEIILLYFFRVVLHEKKSLDAQLLQIEFRKSLCEVIQGYADFAKELREKHDISLEKFEDLIFSNIMATEDKMPSTFDGMEHLSGLLQSLKGKS